ncbi:MAG: integration host factor [Actinobacteria bacterium]|nr:integration host factor [Actinomycetota bacterium]MBL7123547.1 integration host factor [Actinomycetota bacterium]
MALKNLSDKDRKKGLEKARRVRKKRAEIKDLLKKGKLDIRSLFKDGKLFKEYIINMKVINLVSALPGNGRVNALEILKDLKISPNKKVGGLGKNQKNSFYKFFNIA